MRSCVRGLWRSCEVEVWEREDGTRRRGEREAMRSLRFEDGVVGTWVSAQRRRVGVE